MILTINPMISYIAEANQPAGFNPGSTAVQETIAQGNRYLDAIIYNGQGTVYDDPAKCLALVARGAANQYLQDDNNALISQMTALEAISQGVSGPVGAILARVAHQTMERVFEANRESNTCFMDGADIGEAYLHGIAAYGNADERIRAAKAIDDGNLYRDEIARFVTYQDAFFEIYSGQAKPPVTISI